MGGKDLVRFRVAGDAACLGRLPCRGGEGSSEGTSAAFATASAMAAASSAPTALEDTEDRMVASKGGSEDEALSSLLGVRCLELEPPRISGGGRNDRWQDWDLEPARLLASSASGEGTLPALIALLFPELPAAASLDLARGGGAFGGLARGVPAGGGGACRALLQGARGCSRLGDLAAFGGTPSGEPTGLLLLPSLAEGRFPSLELGRCPSLELGRRGGSPPCSGGLGGRNPAPGAAATACTSAVDGLRPRGGKDPEELRRR
mmetsp:Transcript_63862/g.152311  ORF Transcript_63862/g.152311 Transcript_63862/m.152311 type:complete len:262 (+) Transcript_63862:155-940(+)